MAMNGGDELCTLLRLRQGCAAGAQVPPPDLKMESDAG
jgi:hypothetical protein